jgi:hypothetical protein
MKVDFSDEIKCLLRSAPTILSRDKASNLLKRRIELALSEKELSAPADWEENSFKELMISE